MEKKNAYLKIVLDFLLAIVGLALLVFALPKLCVCFLPFVIGWIISLIANPMVRFLEKKIKIVRKHGSAIFIVLAVIIIVALFYSAGYFLYDQAKSIAKEAPHFSENFEHQYKDVSKKYTKMYNQLPQSVREYFDDFGKKMSSKEGFNIGGGNSIDFVGKAVKNVVIGIVYTIFTILAAYFFTADREILLKKARKVFPKSMVKNIKIIKDNFVSAVGGYFKAQFKIMFILIAIMYVVFKIFEIKYAFLLATFTGILDVLPVFGTGAVLWPGAVYYVITGQYGYAVGMMVLYAVCQLVKNFLQPKMVGDCIGLNPLLTLFLLFLGYKIGGLVGILIALPLGIVVINFYKAGAFQIWIDDVKFISKQIEDFRNKHVSYIHNEVTSEEEKIEVKINESK